MFERMSRENKIRKLFYSNSVRLLGFLNLHLNFSLGKTSAKSDFYPTYVYQYTIYPTCVKQKRRVGVEDDSVLRGMKVPLCRLDPSHKEGCCLTGACVQDFTRTLPELIQQ